MDNHQLLEELESELLRDLEHFSSCSSFSCTSECIRDNRSKHEEDPKSRFCFCPHKRPGQEQQFRASTSCTKLMQSLRDNRCTRNKEVENAFSMPFLPPCISGFSSTNSFNGEFHNVPGDAENTDVNIEVVPKSGGLSYSSIQFPIKDVAPQCAAFMQTNQVQIGNNTCNNAVTHKKDHKCNHLVHKKDSSSCITSDTKSMDACISAKCRSGCVLDQDIVPLTNQIVNIGQHSSPLNHDSAGDYSTASSPVLLNAPTSAAATGLQPDEVAFRDRFVPLKTTQSSIKEQVRVMAALKAKARWSKVEESLRHEKELRSCTKTQAWWKATPAPARIGHGSARNRADKFCRMQKQSSMAQGDLMSEATRGGNQKIEERRQKKFKEGFIRHVAEDSVTASHDEHFEIMQGIELQQLKTETFKAIKKENVERMAVAVEDDLSKAMRDTKLRELLENHCMTYEEQRCKALLKFENRRQHEQEVKEGAAILKEDVASNEWNTIMNIKEKLLTPLQRLCNRDQMDLCAAFLTHSNEKRKLTSAKTTSYKQFFKNAKHYHHLQPPAHLLYFPFPSAASADVIKLYGQQQRILVNSPSITSNVSLHQLYSRTATPITEIEGDQQSDLDDDISNKPLTMELMSHLGPLNKLKELDLSVEGLSKVCMHCNCV